MINVQRMFNLLSLCHTNENGSMHKCCIQRIDSVFQVMTAVSQPLINLIAMTVIRSFFQRNHFQSCGLYSGKGKGIKSIYKYKFIGLCMAWQTKFIEVNRCYGTRQRIGGEFKFLFKEGGDAGIFFLPPR